MRRSGRASLLAILATLSAVVVVALLFFGSESAQSVGSRFMSCLAKGDVDGLTKLSYMEGKTPEEIKEKWAYATQKVAPFYRFVWRPVSSTDIDKDTANVKVEVVTDALSGQSYPEFFELPMRKVDGQWKVEVGGIDRKMYPGLPR